MSEFETAFEVIPPESSERSEKSEIDSEPVTKRELTEHQDADQKASTLERRKSYEGSLITPQECLCDIILTSPLNKEKSNYNRHIYI